MIKKTMPGQLILCIFLSCSLALAMNLIFQLSGFSASSQSYDEARRTLYSISFLQGLIMYGLVTPLYEEILFRLLFFRTLCRFMPLFPAAFLCAAGFGIYHMNIVQGIYAFVLSFLIIYLYVRSEYSFLIPFAAHAGANIFVYVLSTKIRLWPGFCSWWTVLALAAFFCICLKIERKK